MTVIVSGFFAPASAKRPINFVVLKYFLLGLLVSNAIESILIIPKILDVLDERRIQTRELEEVNIKRQELQELVAEKRAEEKGIIREEEREVKTVLKKVQRTTAEIEKALKEGEEEFEREQEAKHATERKSHHKVAGGPGGHKGRAEEEEEEEEYEDEEEEEEHTAVTGGAEHAKHDGKEHEKKKKAAASKGHVTVRKRPQRKETGANLVAVFMLFYGSTTLCLGMTAIFKESALLLAILMGVTGLGIVILISAGFSLIMILSCCKDIMIAILTYKYRDMIVTSDMPLPTAVNVAAGGADLYDPNNLQMPQQVSY